MGIKGVTVQTQGFSLGSLAFKDEAESTVQFIKTVGTTPETVYSITDVGSAPTLTVSGDTLVFNAGTTPTKGTAQTVVGAVNATPDTVTVG